MKDIFISILILLVIIIVRASYDKTEIDHVPYSTLTLETLEDKVDPDDVFLKVDL